MKQTAVVKLIKKDPCPYCDRAMTFLKNKGVTVEVVDLTNRLDELKKWKDKTGWATVPIILVNEKLIGGYNDMKALDEEGGFDKLVFS